MPIRSFLEELKKNDPHIDENLVSEAYVFSMEAHGAQKRASGELYFTHPLEVARILSKLKLDTATIVTALLHDTVEDTLVTLDDIKSTFGEEIAFLVNGVTKLSHVKMLSDQEKKAEKFRKLLVAMSEDIRVLLVKLADRLHNMHTLSYIACPQKRRAIAQETMDIYVPLAERIGLRTFKEQLEDLAFAQLHPKDREFIVARLRLGRYSYDDFIQPITALLLQMLKEKGINAHIKGREKTPYSIWRNMESKHVDFDQMTDIVAFRMIVDTIEDCYKALGAIHSTYAAIPGFFKDFVSLPKANNYRSIHTVIIGPLQRRIEIQIRTHEMDEICEYGVAAHWQYKQGGTMKKDAKHYQWMRSLLEILEHASNSEEFLEHTHLGMFQDEVFCFTPQGDLITLPKGATSVDFAYAVHSEIGHTCVGARINGRIMPLKTHLQNGDQVEVIRSSSQTPSVLMEKLVVTGKAKSQIRRFIRLKRRIQLAALGKSILEKIFQSKRQVFSENFLVEKLPLFRCATLHTFYACLGEGVLTGEEAFQEIFSSNNLRLPSPELLKKTEDTNVFLVLHGMIPEAMIFYATCCDPRPHKPVKATYAPQEGVIVHAVDCLHLGKNVLHDHHHLSAFWKTNRPPQRPQNKKTYTTAFYLSLTDKPGALAKIASLIACGGGNIVSINSYLRNKNNEEDIYLSVEVDSEPHYKKLLESLRKSPLTLSIEEVYPVFFSPQNNTP